ncbi:MAG: hypothetical protein U5L45_24120 [Saprospiraceae bacterium]|nr:hypothetical protein [Saprospiraceae bacterium]
MVHFSGFARKMNHIPPSRMSEASAKRVLKFYVAFQSCFLLSILINYIIFFSQKIFSENQVSFKIKSIKLIC